MAEYFTARGLPVPRELSQNPLTNWKRNAILALTLLVVAVGLRITNIDFTYTNPEYASRQVAQLFHWDTRILTPQNEFETFWDTAEGLMITTIFLGITATVLSVVIDLGADLPDLQLAQRFAKTVEHPRHPVHELGTVVGHEIQRVAAELDAVAQPDQDWGDLLARGDAQAEHVAGVVVDQAIAPGLEVAATLELDKEGTLDGDVPERIDAGALVARTALARARGPARTQVVEELFDPGVADSGDPAPAQLGRDALGVPVRVQAHRDHDLLHPSRVLEQRVPRPAPLGNEPEQTAPRVRALPAPQARSAADAKRERGKDAVLAGDTEHAGPSAYVIELSAKGCALEWAATSGRQEPEAGTLLVRVSKPPTLRVADLVNIVREDLVHAADPSGPVSETTGNLN